MAFDIKRYDGNKDREIWNQFVKMSKQGTFLFDRSYMDYHSDRFADHSLLIYKNDKLYAILPGNQADHIFYSHQGLTYGGLITNNKATTQDICLALSAINEYLKAQQFRHVVYKAIPWIYHQLPAEEDSYALVNIANATIKMRHISSTIVLGKRSPFTESRRSGIRKAFRANLQIKECKADGVGIFWNILNNNLHLKYGVQPVHTEEELRLLMHRFPDNIKCYVVYKKDEPLGGTVLYITPQVVHTQYISASPKGKAEGALDLLFDYLINHKEWNAQYFDFGKSSDGDGHELNQSLIFQKEGFGGRGVVYDTYEWDL